MITINISDVDVHPEVMAEWYHRTADYLYNNGLNETENPGPIKVQIAKHGNIIMTSEFTDGYVLSFSISKDDWTPIHEA